MDWFCIATAFLILHESVDRYGLQFQDLEILSEVDGWTSCVLGALLLNSYFRAIS